MRRLVLQQLLLPLDGNKIPLMSGAFAKGSQGKSCQLPQIFCFCRCYRGEVDEAKRDWKMQNPLDGLS